jgi:acetyl-CoA C-acetyltransferase
MAEVFSTALGAAGIGADDLAHLDLYSSFASSVNLAVDALGTDPSSVTVTGGLPFAGGAGSNYLTHSIAAMVDVLRADPGTYGMTTGVGMHLTKHVTGVWSTEPGPVSPPPALPTPDGLPITDEASGPAEVVTYTVIHGRDGAAETGVAVCDLPDGTRAYAKVDDAGLLAHVEEVEWVGAEVELATDGGRNTVLA